MPVATGVLDVTSVVGTGAAEVCGATGTGTAAADVGDGVGVGCWAKTPPASEDATLEELPAFLTGAEGPTAADEGISTLETVGAGTLGAVVEITTGMLLIVEVPMITACPVS